MFADYRVPQLLRHAGVLRYSTSLARRVDAFEELQAGSDEETEIRALTIVAVDLLHSQLLLLREKVADVDAASSPSDTLDALAQSASPASPRALMVIELDWLLWQKGEAIKSEISPHHRTRTIYY
jgi:hypothetical protein